jgi:hypothetical protein
MNEEVKTNEAPVVEEAVIVESAEGFDYFNGVNKVLTSLLAGIFGAGILFALVYFGAELVSADLSEANGLTITFILLAVVAVFLSMFIAQTIQQYLYKLVEKETYTEVTKNIYANLISQLILLVIAFPFVFITFSKGGSALAVMFISYFVFSLAISSVIRERNMNDRLVGNMLGLFLSAMIFTIFVLGNSEMSPLLAVVALPVGMALESLFDMLSEIAVYLVNKR